MEELRKALFTDIQHIKQEKKHHIGVIFGVSVTYTRILESVWLEFIGNLLINSVLFLICILCLYFFMSFSMFFHSLSSALQE